MRVFGPFSFLNRLHSFAFLKPIFLIFLLSGVACTGAGCSFDTAQPQFFFTQTNSIEANASAPDTIRSGASSFGNPTGSSWGVYSGARGQTAPSPSGSYVYLGDREPVAEGTQAKRYATSGITYPARQQ